MSNEDISGLQSNLAVLDQTLSQWLAMYQPQEETYAPDVEKAYQRLKAGIGRSSDVVIRKVSVPSCPEGPVVVAGIEGMVDEEIIDEDVLGPLLTATTPPAEWGTTTLTPLNITAENQWSKLLSHLASGETLIFAPGLTFVWVVEAKKVRQRSPQRPQTEQSVKGPEEAFGESLSGNKAQLRRCLKTPQLQFRDLLIGKTQNLTVSVAYLEGVANPALLNTAMARLQAIDIDGTPWSTTIAGLIRDHPRSIFPTLRATERLDITVWRLLEGKVCIMVDGDPFVLIAPAPLADFYRTAMDYSSSWVDSTFVRIIRFGGWLMGIYLPALYVGFAQVNPNILPTSLYINMQGSHVGLPFPPLLEVTLMVLVIEILREAALRLPSMLGGTIGTVGAIVVGTAIVRAGVVDPQIIVVMTLTALSLFSTPVYELSGSWRVVGFSMILVGALLGILGIVAATIVVTTILMDMSSFGTPYFEPWAPFRGRDWMDTITRFPWSSFRSRITGARPVRVMWRRPERVSARPHLIRARRRL